MTRCREDRIARPRLTGDSLRRRYPARVRLEIGRFDDDNDGGGVGLQRVGFVALKDGSHTAREANPCVAMSDDRDPAVDHEERCGVSDRGGGDVAAFLQVKATDVGVAAAVGEGDEARAGCAETFEGIGGTVGEVDDAHVIPQSTGVCPRRRDVVKTPSNALHRDSETGMSLLIGCLLIQPDILVSNDFLVQLPDTGLGNIFHEDNLVRKLPFAESSREVFVQFLEGDVTVRL
jgi:hypothetical protein